MKQFLLSILLILSLSIIPVWAEEAPDGVLDLLSQLEIMQGDPDGNLRLDDCVTRAEFTKMAVASSAFRNSVAKSLSISPFPDVTFQHWSAPYVRVGVTNGLVSGYPDATFHPDDGVLFEEGVTIMLRVLGYTDSDFGVSWPYGQLGLAQNLDMTTNLTCTAGEVMNRRQVAQLIYNSLKVNQKSGNSQLAQVFGVQIQEDITLIADGTDDASISAGEVFTSSGTYKTNTTMNRNLFGSSGDVAIKNNTTLLSFVPDSQNNATENYVVYSTLSDSVMAYKNNTLQAVKIDDSTTAYKGKSQMTFGALKSSLSMGDILRVKTINGDIDYITWQKGRVKGPLTIRTSDWGSSWGITEDTTIMRNGIATTTSGLQSYDIAYYLEDLNMVLSYSDKVTGVYEKANPNTDAPLSVTVSGKEYTIEGSGAFQKLSSGGSFLLGDTVTLLLGKDGGVADVATSASVTTDQLAGYVLESGRKSYQVGSTDNYTGYYVKLVLPNGETVEYTTTKDCGSYLNQVVKVSFKDGSAALSSPSSSVNPKMSGTFSWDTKKLGSYTIASNVEILDIGTDDSTNASAYVRIYPQRLDGVKLSADNILFCSLDNSGAISKLILDNVTNDSFSFGLVTYAVNENTTNTLSGSYRLLVDGQLYSVNTNNRVLNINAGQGIMLGGNPANPNFVSKLIELKEKITKISSSHLLTSSESYPISPNVSVYRKTTLYSSEYVKIPLTDIIGKEGLNYFAYYDKAPSGGGQVRVIVAYE